MKSNMKNLFFLSFVFLLFSCGNTATTEEAVVSEDTATNRTEIVEETETKINEKPGTETTSSEVKMEDLYGYYVGMFDAQKMGKGKHPTWSNKINISIDKIDGEKLEGHSVVAGNNRPFSGTIKQYNGNEYQVEAKEPGDDKYDGVFTFTILVNEQEIEGKWVANNENLSVIERSYELDKKDFKYQPDLDLSGFDYVDLYDTYDEETGEAEMLTDALDNLNPSNQELTKKDVENMYQGDLEVMRNSIYAKHGYSFKNRRMRYVFNHVDWYIPVHTDIRSELTELEKKNIELIKRYENHADKYYDAFGR